MAKCSSRHCFSKLESQLINHFVISAYCMIGNSVHVRSGFCHCNANYTACYNYDTFSLFLLLYYFNHQYFCNLLYLNLFTQ